MKLLNDLFKRSKALCGQLMSSMFDSNNPATAVDQLFESTEKTSSVFEESKALEKNTPLSDVPNIDYYMDSKGVRGENDEKKIGKEEGAEYIQEEKNNKDYVDDPNLDNSCGKQLIFELPTLLEEQNKLRTQTTDENVISTILFCESRIEEMMLACGCEPINEESTFDNSRHVPHPFSFVQNGCIIEKTIKPGLSYNNKVLVKAIVKCKQ